MTLLLSAPLQLDDISCSSTLVLDSLEHAALGEYAGSLLAPDIQKQESSTRCLAARRATTLQGAATRKDISCTQGRNY